MALDWKKSVMTCISCSSWTELSLFDFDLVKRMNSAMISRTSSVSLGDRVADEEALGEALSVASDRQE